MKGTISIDQSLHFNCSSCGNAEDVSLRWLESNYDFTCTKCGEVINIITDDVREKIAITNNQTIRNAGLK